MKNKLFSFRVKKLGKDLAQNDRLVINALKYGVSIILFLLCGSLLILLQGQSPWPRWRPFFRALSATRWPSATPCAGRRPAS